MDSVPTTKCCTKCRRELEPSAFAKDRQKKDGLYSSCRECVAQYTAANSERLNAYNRAWYAANRELGVALTRDWQDRNRERVRGTSRQWKAEHPEEQRALKRAAYARNPEPTKKKARLWRIDNPERDRQNHRRWEIENPEAAKALRVSIGHARRARKTAAGGRFTKQEWADLCALYGNCCLACGASGVTLTVDHVVPIARGGDNWITNIQPLCLTCNKRKGTQTIDYRPATPGGSTNIAAVQLHET